MNLNRDFLIRAVQIFALLQVKKRSNSSNMYGHLLGKLTCVNIGGDWGETKHIHILICLLSPLALAAL
jgi:hypothetical protein